MDDAMCAEKVSDGYEMPALTEYGSIEEWTKGTYAEAINVSVIF